VNFYFQGVAVSSSELTPIEDRATVELRIKELISIVLTKEGYMEGESNSNTSHVANITIVSFDFTDDLSSLPELVFLFTFLNCEETHNLNERVSATFGEVVHIALTGVTQQLLVWKNEIH